MPVVAQNRGWKTGDTSHQYEHIFKRTYQHVIRKGKAAALDPIPEGLGYAYADAYRRGKHDATKGGSSNFRFLLTHRIKRFKDIGVRVQKEECEKHCRRMAHKWICDVFGAHRFLDPRLGQAGKDMLQQKLDQKYKQLKDEMERTNKWNSFMTDDLRRAENDCLELITDEETRKLVHDELETARTFIENHSKEERRKALEKAAKEAWEVIVNMLADIQSKVEKYKDGIDFSNADVTVNTQEALDRHAKNIGDKAGIAVGAANLPEHWPGDNQTKFYSKQDIDERMNIIYKVDTYKSNMNENKFVSLGYLYELLTEYRKTIVDKNTPRRPRAIVRPKPKPSTGTPPPPKPPKPPETTKPPKPPKPSAPPVPPKDDTYDALKEAEANKNAIRAETKNRETGQDAKDKLKELKEKDSGERDETRTDFAYLRQKAARWAKEIRAKEDLESYLLIADNLFNLVDKNEDNFISKREFFQSRRLDNRKWQLLFNLDAGEGLMGQNKYNKTMAPIVDIMDHFPQEKFVSRDEFIIYLFATIEKDGWGKWQVKRDASKEILISNRLEGIVNEETEGERNRRRAAKAGGEADDEAKRRQAEAEAEKQRQAKEAKAKKAADRARAKEVEAKRLAEEEEKRQAKEAADRARAKEAEKQRLAEEAEKQRLAEEAEKQRLAEEAEKQRLAEEAEKQRLAEEAEKQRLAEEAEKQRLAEEAKAKRLVEEKRQRIDAAKDRLKTSQQPSRQQEIGDALKTSMDEANKPLAVTIDQLFAEPQKSNHCLQHSINNVIGKALFTESDFYNEQDGGYVKTELDRLLKDEAQHEHRIHAQWFRERNRVFDRFESESGLNVPVLSKEELTLLVSGRKDLLGFIVHTTKADGHWVAVKRVTIGESTVFVEIDSIGPAITQVAENVAQLHKYLTSAPRDGDTVDAIFAMSEYEYLEHEAKVIMSSLQFVLNYTLNFVRHSDKNRDRRILEYAVLIVDKDGFKENLAELDQSARERVARLLRQADDLLKEQSYDKEKLVKPAMRALLDAVALPSTSSDAKQQIVAREWEKVEPTRVAEDLGIALDAWTAQASSSLPSGTSSGNAAGEAWRELTGVMETALERGWEMFEKWQQAAQGRVDAESSADLIAALPVLPFREEPMPTPLQFFDFADFAVDAEAPPSPPRVMLR